MDFRLGVLALHLLTACGVAQAPRLAQSASTREPAGRQQLVASTPTAPAKSSPTPSDGDHESDADEIYLRETERSIALYRQFIERAGDDPSYAEEVNRSRQQIEDLTASAIFVRNGIAARKGAGNRAAERGVR